MSNPYGVPSAPPQKSRTGLYIGVACGCLLLVTILVVVVGAGLWLLSRDGGGEGPTSGPSTSQTPSEDPTTIDDPTDDPTTEDPTDDPSETPSEDPSSDPLSSASSSFSLEVVATPVESTTVETQDETLETENGKFIAIAVNITNTGTEDIGLRGKSFRFYDDAGTAYSLRYASFSTSGPQVTPGEEATALLYADVPADMVLASVSYTDEVGTGGEEISFPVG